MSGFESECVCEGRRWWLGAVFWFDPKLTLNRFGLNILICKCWQKSVICSVSFLNVQHRFPNLLGNLTMWWVCTALVCMTCSEGIACFHTTESQHRVYWEYYLYGQNRCTQMSGSHWLWEFGGVHFKYADKMYQTAQVSKYICLNWHKYLSKIKNVFVMVHFKDKLIGSASPAHISK